MITTKQRAALRKYANGIEVILIIGKNGVTPTVLKQLNDAFPSRELVKGKVLENSMYTVLSPEGFASILWKDSRRADEAAEVMQVTPKSLLKQGVIEGIIEEPSSHKKVIKNVARVLTTQLEPLLALSCRELIARRQARFRKF